MTNINKISLDDTEEIALEKYVHTPQEAGNALYELSLKLYGEPGISTGHPLLDDVIPSTIPGWIRIWIARPGELKSTMLRIIAKTEAQRIVNEGLHDRCVVYVTYEEAVDTQELLFTEGIDKAKFWKGQVEPSTVRAAALKRNQLPIYWIGESMLKNSEDKSPMSVNMVTAGINAIKKAYGLKSALVLWDYIQETQVDRNAPDRKQKIIDAMGDVIRMCQLVGIPIDIGSQAKQVSVDNTPWPIPKQGDSEYSFYPEQKGQIVTGMWRPWNTHRDHYGAQTNGINLQGWSQPFQVEPNLTIFRTSKARYEKQWKSIGVLVDPVTMTIKPVPWTIDELERSKRFS